MRKLDNQAAVGRVMGIKKSAVSYLLSRAFEKVREQAAEMEEEMPSEFGEWLFDWEIEYKRKLIYYGVSSGTADRL